MPREVRVLTAVGFILALGFGIVAPAIPLFARSLGVGTTAIGSAISAVAFTRLVSALGSGWLVERAGGRIVLAAGLVLVGVTTGLAGLAGSFSVFLGLRAVAGVGTAMISVASLALLLGAAPPAQRARAAATYQGGYLLGGLAGPALGGLVTDLSPRLPFFLYAAILLAAGAVAITMLRSVASTLESGETGSTAEHVAAQPALRSVLRSRVYLVALVTNLGVGWFLVGVRLSLVPLYVTEELGRSAAWAGAGLLAGSVAQVVGLRFAGRLADTWGRRPALTLGAVTGALFLGVLVLPPATGLFLLSMAGYGLAASLLGSVPAALVGDVAPARSGRVVAVFQMSADLGSITGPLVAGWLTEAVSFQAAFGVTALVTAAGAVAAFTLPRR
jgi:MFS family permease